MNTRERYPMKNTVLAVVVAVLALATSSNSFAGPSETGPIW